ncbi:MAG TPA: universal stress protein [Burkholderiales bacterium]|nr:universal stress protein [Burkholderiales bacterium]
MYKNIMVPVDGSPMSTRAIKECIALAKSSGAKVTMIHVVSHFHLHFQPWGAPKSVHQKIEKDHEDEARQAAQAMVERLAGEARAAGITCETIVPVSDHPYEEIIGEATKRRCDLIIMASHGHKGLNAVLLGSETAKVLTHAKIPVLVVH